MGAPRSQQPTKDRTMNTTAKLHPGQPFNAEVFKRVEGADFTFGAPGKWQALFVFRGHHCPICKSYLTKIEEWRASFDKLGITVAAVSAETKPIRPLPSPRADRP